MSSTDKPIGLFEAFLEEVRSGLDLSDHLCQLTQACKGETPEDAVARLKELSERVDGMEQELALVREYVAAEEAGVRKAKELVQKLRAQQSELMYTESCLERVLPAPAVGATHPHTAPSHSATTSSVLGSVDTNAEEASADAYAEVQEEEEEAVQRRPAPAPRKRREKAVPLIDPLTEEEFENIPGYLKGRLTLERINKAIEEVQDTLRKKYHVLALPVTRMADKTLRKYKKFKAQEDQQTKGHVFFADSDLAAGKHLRADATGKSVLSILRQFGRIKNATGAGTKRYIVCA